MPFWSMDLSNGVAIPCGSSRREVKYRVESSTVSDLPNWLDTRGSILPSGTWRARAWCKPCKVSMQIWNLSQPSPASWTLWRRYRCCCSLGLYPIFRPYLVQNPIKQKTHLLSTGGRSLFSITPCMLSTSSSFCVSSMLGIVSLQYVGFSFNTGFSLSICFNLAVSSPARICRCIVLTSLKFVSCSVSYWQRSPINACKLFSVIVVSWVRNLD